jgi:hypothetical protein
MGTTGEYYRKSAGNSGIDRRAPVIFTERGTRQIPANIPPPALDTVAGDQGPVLPLKTARAP